MWKTVWLNFLCTVTNRITVTSWILEKQLGVTNNLNTVITHWIYLETSCWIVFCLDQSANTEIKSNRTPSLSTNQNNNLIFQFLAFDCIARLRRSGLQRKRRSFVVFGVPGASPVNMFRSGWNGGVGTSSTLPPTRGLVFPEFLILVVALRFCEAGYESIVGAGGARFNHSNFLIPIHV